MCWCAVKNSSLTLIIISWLKSKGKGSPYSITQCSVPELIPVLGSQPAGDVSHKPGGRLPLLFTRPAVTPATLKRVATSFAAWWTEARWVWTVCLRLLPDSVATAIWTQAFCAWVQHANHSAIEPPISWLVMCNLCVNVIAWAAGADEVLWLWRVAASLHALDERQQVARDGFLSQAGPRPRRQDHAPGVHRRHPAVQ